MVQRPRSLGLLAMAALVVAAQPAGATAPCFDVCHLQQGQPLLLADTGSLWLRRCATAKAGASEVCVLERVDASGGVLEQVPLEKSYDDDAFEAAHLDGHTVVRLGHQTAWTDLTRPYKIAPYQAPSSILRFDRDTLVCGPPATKAPAIRRPLGCTPRSVYVFAAGVARDGKAEDPTGLVAVVATCASGRGTREAIAICRPAR
jgi:hypothetical protein